MAALPAPTPILSVSAPVPATPDAVTLNRVEAFLGDLVGNLAAPADALARPRGRPPILPGLLLWSGLLVCILRRATSQIALWRLLTATGLWHFPRVAISDDAIYKRLATDGPAALESLFADLTTLLMARLDLLADRTLVPWASEVLAIDQTTLDPIARRLPSLRDVPAGDFTLLPGKLAAVFDLRRQLWRRIEYLADPHQNEKVAARDLVVGLAKDCLLVFDLGYFSFRWFDDLTDAGYRWISRLREKTSYETIHLFYQHGDTLDALVWLGKHRADRAQYAVRLVQFRQDGKLRRFVTNVPDPRLLPMDQIARVYARRWDIEMAVNLVKTHLGLHLLWSAKPAVILVQVWAVLIIAQVVQALRVEIAGTAQVDVFDVSLPLLVQYLPLYASRGSDPIGTFVADARRLRFIRPSRRTQIEAPDIPPEAYLPPPVDLVVVRKPRYANRKCGARSPQSPN
jgi:hypothetical protein